MFFCPVHNASTPCSLQAFGIRCILNTNLKVKTYTDLHHPFDQGFKWKTVHGRWSVCEVGTVGKISDYQPGGPEFSPRPGRGFVKPLV